MIIKTLLRWLWVLCLAPCGLFAQSPLWPGHTRQRSTLPPQARITSADTLPRPKVAVVLAGGGAKGAAHVSALKAIEEAGIPIDLVVGTSIGSIVGGLYCTGYSPDSLRTLIGQTDWISMILNKTRKSYVTLTDRHEDEEYILRFGVDAESRRSATGKGGLLTGKSVEAFLQSVTSSLPDTLDFAEMPVPFAAVTTRATDGVCKVFTSGNVPQAMRASMAIPSVFTPVVIDGVTYVDGGVVDNFPVDVARALGADIVIGVNLVVKQTEEQLTNSAVDLLMHCIDFYSAEQYSANIADADVYIPIDVTGYTAASFTPEALDTLLCRGDYYVGLKRPALDSLARALALPFRPHYPRLGSGRCSSHMATQASTTAQKAKKEEDTQIPTVNFGWRFDLQDYAVGLLKGEYPLHTPHGSVLSERLRLGSHLQSTTTYSHRTISSQRVALSYTFNLQDIDLYTARKKAIDFTERRHYIDMSFQQSWHNIRYTFGLDLNFYRYSNVLAMSQYTLYFNDAETTTMNRYFSYYAKGEYNSLDYQCYPTRGLSLTLAVNFISDNLLSYQHQAIFPIFCGNLTWAIPIGQRFSFIPHAKARLIVPNDAEVPLSLRTYVGGYFDGQHNPSQIAMAGVTDLQLFDENMTVLAGLTAQVSPFNKQYAFFSADVLFHSNDFKDLTKREQISWGIRTGYAVRTPLGPLSLSLEWNVDTHQLEPALSAGYFF